MSIIWFRKCLRIHDNQALISAIESKLPILPIFILDPNFMKFGRCGINRWNFLFQSLEDLNESFKKLGSSLIVFRGNPKEIFDKLLKTNLFRNLFFEKDTEPYSLQRDEMVKELCSNYKVSCKSFLGHTLYDPKEIIELNDCKAPTSYTRFITLISKMEKINECSRNPSKSEIKDFKDIDNLLKLMNYTNLISIPNLDELVDKEGNKINSKPTTSMIGGEQEALNRMIKYLEDKKKVQNFKKPETSPAQFDPASTTVLSPYLKFGCLSVKKFYHEIRKIIDKEPKSTKPPCSLLGQLYWREMFYTCSVGFNNFNKMKDNTVCKQVDWRLQNINENDEVAKKQLDEWTNGKTGYPWIDALMIQLRQEGWIHHLGRHSVACYLTRGDLYISWERGMEVFEELLLDADYALNAGNWLWLSGTSSFFTAYFRIYSPVAFPKKYDPNGNFIRKYIPELKDLPKEYIYEPWNAPKAIQIKSKCIIGKDYPERHVIHENASKINIQNLKNTISKKKNIGEKDEESEDESEKKDSKKKDNKKKDTKKKEKYNKEIFNKMYDKKKSSINDEIDDELNLEIKKKK